MLFILQLVLPTLLFSGCTHSQTANSPPRFLVEGGPGSEIVVQLREGEEARAGGKVTRLRGYDADGDDLQFGILGRGSDFVRLEQVSSTEADLFLLRDLDHEQQDEYEIILTLTDAKLGTQNYITQSLLILVEDRNDNPPVFLRPQTSVSVKEHSTPKELTRLTASDLDSGAFGQVIYRLKPGQDVDVEEKFTISTRDGSAVLNLVGDLDYETKRLYEVLVEAQDRASQEEVNSAVATVIVKVIDIPDQGPEWIDLKPVARKFHFLINYLIELLFF